MKSGRQKIKGHVNMLFSIKGFWNMDEWKMVVETSEHIEVTINEPCGSIARQGDIVEFTATIGKIKNRKARGKNPRSFKVIA